jgi:antitoxin (DNA-binding transcriptional repressor) of toxin-antitoxin stability system
MPKEIIHVSDADAASDFKSLLARVRAGADVVIEHDARAVAILQPAEPSVRPLSESLRLAREHGSSVTLDPDFGADVEAGIATHRQPLEPPV